MAVRTSARMMSLAVQVVQVVVLFHDMFVVELDSVMDASFSHLSLGETDIASIIRFEKVSMESAFTYMCSCCFLAYSCHVKTLEIFVLLFQIAHSVVIPS